MPVAVARGGSHHRSQQERDRVVGLPGLPVNKVNFSQFSGYVTVDEKTDRNLFYWLIESPVSNKPNLKPLVLWLNGGPGCSSVAYGASEEVGPFRAQPDGKALTLSPYAWNKAEDTYTFLTRWFKRFPQYRHRPFYIAGESYAGHYIPQISIILTRLNKGIDNPIINFKGFLLGNPLIDDYLDNEGSFDYWLNHGLISDSTYKALKDSCLNESFLFPKGECNGALFKAYSEFGDINPYDIYGPVCSDFSAIRQHYYNNNNPLPYTYKGNDDCVVTYTTKYMNRPDVQKALHANITGSIPHPWKACSDVVRSSWTDSPKSMLPVFEELIAAGVQIWVFSGDTDAVLPLTSTRYSINALNLSTITEWYPWYDSGKVGGWSQVYDGLTYLTVRGAGHEVPLTRPELASLMFQHFLRNQSMPQITTKD
ncbi:Serine carboxypeptidase-like 28 [Bienertia sinuspersici]